MEKVGNLLARVFDKNGVPKRSLAPAAPKAPADAAPPAKTLPPPVFTPPPSTNVYSSPSSASSAFADRPKRYPRRRSGPKTDPVLVKGILSKALAGKGLDKQIERYEFVLHWAEIVGDTAAQISKPECISRRSLVVRVAHSAWAQELTFLKPVILQKLAPFLKHGDVVDDIVFRIG